MRSRRLLRLLRIYPPFLGAGIRVRRMTEDLREVDVEMKLRWWNANYVGTHYGGSVRAAFRLTQQQLDELRAQVDAQGKIEPTFTVQIRDQQNEVVAEVEKLLHIRRKDAKTAPSP